MLATRGPAPSAPRGERGITPPRPATSCADAPIIGSTSSNVAICSDIVCVECARLSLTSQFSCVCVSKLSTHSTHKVARREQEPTVLARWSWTWSCWWSWRAQRGAGQPSHVASLHPRPGVYSAAPRTKFKVGAGCVVLFFGARALLVKQATQHALSRRQRWADVRALEAGDAQP